VSDARLDAAAAGDAAVVQDSVGAFASAGSEQSWLSTAKDATARYARC
jgi:hypothetical protein